MVDPQLIVEPFTLAVEEGALADLKRRLAATRWPEPPTVAGWAQGVPLDRMQALCDYWRDRYDWRRCEAALNDLGQYKAAIDGLDIHFIHVRSPEPDALPIVLTHGWPGSVIEFMKVIRPLADPVAFGGDRKDAFHVIVPSLPGYGFSDKPREAGWNPLRIANTWIRLVRGLGYDRFVAQGGDWGAAVTSRIAYVNPPELLGIHLNMPASFPTAEDMEDLTEREKHELARLETFSQNERAYGEQQRTRPQTIGYGLADSPVGQAAWIYEKFERWSDCDGDPMNSYSADEVLDNIMLYWLTNSGASAARLYWEGLGDFAFPPTDVPTGISVFPKEIFGSSPRWLKRTYSQLVHYNEVARGGHFAAFEAPDIFIDEVRAFARKLR